MFNDIKITVDNLWVFLFGLVFYTAIMWILFVKANKPGWYALIPFYNLFILFKITWGNGWIFLTFLLPIVSFAFYVITCIKLAKAFGRSTWFGLGIIFLDILFLPFLAFDGSKYIGPQ